MNHAYTSEFLSTHVQVPWGPDVRAGPQSLIPARPPGESAAARRATVIVMRHITSFHTR